MNIIDTTKSLLENLYYLSGILILISIFIGLWQLILTKKAIKISSLRSAADLSAKQIEIYFDKTIPLQDIVYSAKINNNIDDDIDIKPGEFNKDYLIEKLGKEEFLQLQKSRSSIVLEVLKMANAMEAFAVYFIKGVADEEIAYSSVGRTFCATVDTYYFDIASCLKKEGNKHWCNLIALYKLWAERLEAEQLTLEKEKIVSQLEKVKNIKVNPIGTV